MSGLLTHPTSTSSPVIEKAERWTVERKFRQVGDPPSSVPFTILLLDRQYYLAAGACFVRHVRQVHHREAAAKLRSIKIPFDPATESLTIHWIRIWRAGEDFSLLEQVEDLEITSTEDGRKVAQFTMADLRPDDCIDLAYTTRAIHPAARFSALHPINQRVPVLDWHLSAIAPAERQLASHCRLPDSEPKVRRLSEGSQFFQWHQRDLPASGRPLGKVPAWYRPTAEIQLSSYANWSEVALEIHRCWQPAAAPAAIGEAAEGFAAQAGEDLLEAARLACRFVQDRIATAPSTKQDLTTSPIAPLADVLEGSSGDAKSKAALLVALFRALGIAAAPVLVSASRSRDLRHQLPAADPLDHVLVRARVDETDLWIDPCESYQGGPVSEPALPAYGFGLQISSRTKNLCAIPMPSAATNQRIITEHFIVREDRSASLSVTMKATGIEANRLRSTLADTTIVEFSRDSLEELRHRYPGAELDAASTVKDDPEANEIVITEKFQLPAIARSDEGEAHFSPRSIRKNLPRIPDGDRSHPIALPFPCNLRHLTVIDTPWEAAPYEASERHPGTGFTFSSKGDTQGKRHTLRYAYNTLDDHLIPVDLDSAQLRIENLRPHLNYRFELPPAAQSASVAKSGKGTRIIKPDTSESRLRKRKSKPKDGPGLWIPALGCAAAIALVLLVKGSFSRSAQAKSETIRAPQIAAQEEREAEIEAPAIPDDPLTYFAPPAPLSSSNEFDNLDLSVGDLNKEMKTASEKESGDGAVKFDLGGAASGGERKASAEKNATSGDWKLSN